MTAPPAFFGAPQAPVSLEGEARLTDGTEVLGADHPRVAPSTLARVVGIDLSLSCTGIAGPTWTTTIATKPDQFTPITRLRHIVDRVTRTVGQHQPDAVIVEGPAFGAKGQGQHDRAGLWWMTIDALLRMGLTVLIANPSSVKKYATGNGSSRTDKDAMLLAAARRFEWFAGDNNEADALWLCALGAEHLGQPLVTMPQANRLAALKLNELRP